MSQPPTTGKQYKPTRPVVSSSHGISPHLSPPAGYIFILAGDKFSPGDAAKINRLQSSSNIGHGHLFGLNVDTMETLPYEPQEVHPMELGTISIQGHT